jgi:hypothetical protein
MTAFFLLQAPAVLLERAFSRALKGPLKAAGLCFDSRRGDSLVWAVLQKLIACSKVVMVFSWLSAWAELTFWPALELCKVDVNGAAEVSSFIQTALGRVLVSTIQ